MAVKYLKGAYKKNVYKLFSRTFSYRTRGNGFNLKEGIFKPDREELFYNETGEPLKEIAQTGGRCPVTGNIQDQVG